MRRINVAGNAGTGKSTVAARLGESLGIEVVGLDQVVWQPGWKKTPPDERRHLEQEIVERETWIVDGVSDFVREAADTIVFLDYPRRVALKRCAKRNLPYLFRSRPGLPEACPEILIAPRLMKLIWRFPETVRPTIMDDFERWRDEKTLVHVRSDDEVEEFLGRLRSA